MVSGANKSGEKIKADTVVTDLTVPPTHWMWAEPDLI